MIAEGENEFRETYKSLREALVAWGPLSNDAARRSEVTAVIAELVAHLGPVVRVYIPARHRQYIAVVFRDEPHQVGAYVRPTLVDHIVKTASSHQLTNRPKYWRTKLTAS